MRVAFGPKGRLLAYGTDTGLVRLWDNASNKELPGWEMQPSPAFERCACQVQSDPSGGQVVSAGSVGIDSLAIAPDNRTLAIGTFDGKIELWDTTTRMRIKSYCGHLHAVHTIAFSQDQSMLASGGADRTVRLWRLNSACAVATLSGHEDFVRAVAFSPDGKHLASGSADTSIRIWETSQGKPVDLLTGHAGTIRSIEYSDDGLFLLTGSEDRTARLWQEAIGKELLRLPAEGQVNAVAFEGGHHLMVAGRGDASAGGKNSGTVRRWDFGRKDEGFTLFSAGPVTSIAFDPDGRRLASAGPDSQIRIWNIDDSNAQVPAKVLPAGVGAVWALAFGPEGTLASGGEDHVLRLWNIDKGTSTLFPGQEGDIWSLAFHPTRPLIAAASGKTIYLWNTQTHQLNRTPETPGSTWTVSFSPDGKLLASGGGDSTLRLWDITTVENAKEVGKTLLTDEIWGVPFGPNGDRIATAGLDRTVHLFTVPKLAPMNVFKASAQHDGLVQSAAFSPDGKWVATASADHTVWLWDVKSGRTVKLESHARPVWWVTFSSNGNWLASGGLDHTIQVRNMKAIESILTEEPAKLLERAHKDTGL
jgi:WD40 repeat protein